MLRTIHLHGSLAKFGKSYDLDVRDPREACHALGMQLPGFRKTVETGHWHLFRGPLDAQNDLSVADLDMALGKAAEIHIMPAAEGAGSAFQIIGGVALFAAGVIAGFNPALMYAGGALALGGVASMLMSPPTTQSYSDREKTDQRPSFIFDGAVNTSTQGLPWPLVYGRMRVGSIVGSVDLSADDIPLEDDAEPSDPSANT